jgi:hypothetical protein
LRVSNSELSVYDCSLFPQNAQLIGHFEKHTKVDQSLDQSKEREDNCGIGGAAGMVPNGVTARLRSSCAPPSIWPSTICAILLWFGVPLLFIEIDQRSNLLFVGGILCIILQASIWQIFDYIL